VESDVKMYVHISFIATSDTANLLHRKPTSSWTSRGNCCVEESDRRNAMPINITLVFCLAEKA
jgi:hypothetical protein